VTAAGQVRVWRPDWPVSVRGALFALRRGAGDPTFQVVGDDVWRGIRTPDGPATLRLGARPRDGEVHAEAWGPGAAWVLHGVPALLGAEDDPSGFRPDLHPLVAEAHAAGLLVHCWTFRDEARFRPVGLDAVGELTAFFAAGVDGVFADSPDTAVAARRSWMMGR